MPVSWLSPWIQKNLYQRDFRYLTNVDGDSYTNHDDWTIFTPVQWRHIHYYHTYAIVPVQTPLVAFCPDGWFVDPHSKRSWILLPNSRSAMVPPCYLATLPMRQAGWWPPPEQKLRQRPNDSWQFYMCWAPTWTGWSWCLPKLKCVPPLDLNVPTVFKYDIMIPSQPCWQ